MIFPLRKLRLILTFWIIKG